MSDSSDLYGPEPGHPTAEEAAAHLTQARRPLLPEPTDVWVYALATLAGGLAVGLAVAFTALSFDSKLWLIGVGAAFAAVGGIMFWEFRAGRVVTRAAKRLRSNGLGLAGGLAALSPWWDLPPPAIFALVAAPVAAAAALTLVLGRR